MNVSDRTQIPFFFFNDTATTEIYTLSLHDALPIYLLWEEPFVIYSQILAETRNIMVGPMVTNPATRDWTVTASRSEEHTSELQSRQYLVCRLLLEKKNDHHHTRERDSLVWLV